MDAWNFTLQFFLAYVPNDMWIIIKESFKGSLDS